MMYVPVAESANMAVLHLVTMGFEEGPADRSARNRSFTAPPPSIFEERPAIRAPGEFRPARWVPGHAFGVRQLAACP